MKRFLLLLAVLLMVGSASAWVIDSPNYTGEITFYETFGIASVNGYPSVTFEWKQITDNTFEARYLWYSVPFELKDGVITSDAFPGSKLIQ